MAEMTWRELRMLAETARGMQEQGAVLKLVQGSLTITPAGSTQPGDDLASIPAVPQQPKRKKLQVKLNNMRIAGFTGTFGDIRDIADCICWTMSAVEKFLVPYYASFLDLPTVQTEIVDRFKDPNVVAYIHLPRSEPADVTELSAAFLADWSSFLASNPTKSLFAVSADDGDHLSLTAVL